MAANDNLLRHYFIYCGKVIFSGTHAPIPPAKKNLPSTLTTQLSFFICKKLCIGRLCFLTKEKVGMLNSRVMTWPSSTFFSSDVCVIIVSSKSNNSNNNLLSKSNFFHMLSSFSFCSILNHNQSAPQLH